MAKRNNYLANVMKSMAFVSADIAKSDLMPNTLDFVSGNKEFIASTYAVLKNPLASTKKAVKAIQQSKLYQALDYGARNAVQDLRTGKLYNKERADAESGKFMGFDSSDYNDLSEFGIEDNWDDIISGNTSSKKKQKEFINETTAGDVKISNAIEMSNAASANTIASSIIDTSNNQVKTARINHASLYLQNEKLFGGLHKDLSVIGATMDSMHKTSAASLQNIDKNMADYFSSTLKLDTERNKILGEMLEIMRSQNKSAADKAKEANAAKDKKKKITWKDINSGGMPDIENYIQLVKSNINKELSNFLPNMGDEDSNILMAFATNPLGEALKAVISGFVPATLQAATKELDSSIGGIFGNLISRLSTQKDKNGIWGILSKVFGVKIGADKNIDTSKYEKGPVPFDGLTRKSIIEVIPGYLSRIEAYITKTPERSYDYNSGRWINTESAKRDLDNIEKNAINNATRDVREYLNPAFKAIRADNYHDQQSLERAKQQVYEHAFKNGDLLNPNVSAEKNNISFAEYPDLYRHYKAICLAIKSSTKGQIYSKRSGLKNINHTSAIINLSKNILDAKQQQEAQYRALEETPGVIQHYISAKGFVDTHGKWDKDTGKFENKNNLLFSKDKYGYTLFDYIRDINIILKWQQEEWASDVNIGLLNISERIGNIKCTCNCNTDPSVQSLTSQNTNNESQQSIRSTNVSFVNRDEIKSEHRAIISSFNSTKSNYLDRIKQSTREEEKRRKLDEKAAEEFQKALSKANAVDLRMIEQVLNEAEESGKLDDTDKILDALAGIIEESNSDKLAEEIRSMGAGGSRNFINKYLGGEDIKSLKEVKDAVKKAQKEKEKEDEKENSSSSEDKKKGIFANIAEKAKQSGSLAYGLIGGASDVLTNLIYRANASIYDVLYKVELKDDETGEKVEGFVNLIKNKLTGTFDKIKTHFKEDVMDPFKKWLGIDKDWEQRFKDSLMGIGKGIWQKFWDANKEVYKPVADQIGAELGLNNKESIIDRNMRESRQSAMDDLNALSNYTKVNDIRFINLLAQYRLNILDYGGDFDKAKTALEQKIKEVVYENTNGLKKISNDKEREAAISAIRDDAAEMKAIAKDYGIELIDSEDIGELAQDFSNKLNNHLNHAKYDVRPYQGTNKYKEILRTEGKEKHKELIKAIIDPNRPYGQSSERHKAAKYRLNLNSDQLELMSQDARKNRFNTLYYAYDPELLAGKSTIEVNRKFIEENDKYQRDANKLLKDTNDFIEENKIITTDNNEQKEKKRTKLKEKIEYLIEQAKTYGFSTKWNKEKRKSILKSLDPNITEHDLIAALRSDYQFAKKYIELKSQSVISNKYQERLKAVGKSGSREELIQRLKNEFNYTPENIDKISDGELAEWYIKFYYGSQNATGEDIFTNKAGAKISKLSGTIEEQQRQLYDLISRETFDDPKEKSKRLAAIGKLDTEAKLAKAFTRYNIRNFSYGTVNKPYTGPTMLSKGELVAENNGKDGIFEVTRTSGPYYLNNATIIDHKTAGLGTNNESLEQAEAHENRLKNKFIDNIIKSHANGTFTEFDSIADANKFLEENNVDKKHFISAKSKLKDLIKTHATSSIVNIQNANGLDKDKILKDAKANIPEMAAGGLVGGILSMIFGLVGGPLAGVAVGAAGSLINKSEFLKNALFGKKTGEKTKDGKDIRDNSGFIKKTIIDKANKYFPNMFKYGMAGIIPGLITPLGPLGGLLAGAAFGALKSNEEFTEKYFGEGGKIGIKNKEKEMLKKLLSGAIKGAGAGALIGTIIGGPFGLLGNAALGSVLGMATTTNDFKDMLLGTEINGERTGGIVGVLKDSVTPFIDAFDNVKTKIVMAFEKSIIDPLQRFVSPAIHAIPIFLGTIPRFIFDRLDKINDTIHRTIGTRLKTMLSPLTNFTAKLLSPITSAVTSVLGLPGRLVGGIGDRLKEYDLKHGDLVNMTPAEAVEWMRRRHNGDDKTDPLLKFAAGVTDKGAAQNISNILYAMNNSQSMAQSDLKKHNRKLNDALTNFKTSDGKSLSGKQIDKIITLAQRGNITDKDGNIREDMFKNISKVLASTGMSQADFTKLMEEDKLGEIIHNTSESYRRNDLIKKIQTGDTSEAELIEKLKEYGITDKNFNIKSKKDRKRLANYLNEQYMALNDSDGYKGIQIENNENISKIAEDLQELLSKGILVRFNKNDPDIVKQLTQVDAGLNAGIDEQNIKYDSITEANINRLKKRGLYDEELSDAAKKAMSNKSNKKTKITSSTINKAASVGISSFSKLNFLSGDIEKLITEDGFKYYTYLNDTNIKYLYNWLGQDSEIKIALKNGKYPLGEKEIDFLSSDFQHKVEKLNENCRSINQLKMWDKFTSLEQIADLSLSDIATLRIQSTDEKAQNGSKFTGSKGEIWNHAVKPFLGATAKLPFKAIGFGLKTTGKVLGGVYNSVFHPIKTTRNVIDAIRDPEQDIAATNAKGTLRLRKGLQSSIDNNFLGSLLGIGGSILGGIGSVAKGAWNLGKYAVGGIANAGKGIFNFLGNNKKRNIQQALENTSPDIAQQTNTKPNTSIGNFDETDDPTDGKDVVQIGDTDFGKVKKGSDGSVELDTSDTNTRAALNKIEKKNKAQELLQKAQMKASNLIQKVFSDDDKDTNSNKGLGWLGKAILGMVLLKSGILQKIFNGVVKPLWTDNIKPWITEKAIPWIKDTLPKVGSWISDKLSGLKTWITEKAVPWVKNTLTDIGSWTLNILGKVKDWLLTDGIPKIAEFLGSAIAVAIKNAPELIKGVAGAIPSAVGGFMDTMTGNKTNAGTTTTTNVNEISGKYLGTGEGFTDENGKKLTLNDIKNGNYKEIYNAEGVKGTIDENGQISFKDQSFVGSSYLMATGNAMKNAFLHPTMGAKAGNAFVKIGNASNKVLRHIPFGGKIAGGMMKFTGNAIGKPISGAAKIGDIAKNSTSLSNFGDNLVAVGAEKFRGVTSKITEKVANSKIAKAGNKIKNVVGNIKTSKAASTIKNATSAITEKAGSAKNVIANATKTAKTAIKGKLQTLLDKIGDFVKGLFDNEKVLGKLKKVFETIKGKAKGSKFTEWVVKLKDNVTKIFKKGTEQGAKKAGSEAIKSGFSKVLKFLGWATIIIDFVVGCDTAEAILGVKDTSILEELACGIANALCNFLIVPSIWPGTSWCAQKICELFGDNLKERQAEADKEYEEYKKETGSTKTKEEYLKSKYSVTGKVGDAAGKVWGGIKKGAKGLWSGAKKVGSAAWSGIKKGAKAYWNITKKVYGTAWKGIKKFGKSTWNVVKTGAKAYINTAKKVYSTAWKGIKKVGSGAVGLVKKGFEFRKNVAKKAFTAAKVGVKKTWETAKQNAAKIAENAKKAWETTTQAVSKVWDGAKDLAGKFKDSLGGVWDKAKEFSSKIGESISSAWSGIKDGIGNIWDSIKDGAGKVVEGFKDGASKLFDGLKSTASSIFDGIKNKATNIWNNVIGWFKNKKDNDKDTESSVAGSGTNEIKYRSKYGEGDSNTTTYKALRATTNSIHSSNGSVKNIKNATDKIGKWASEGKLEKLSSTNIINGNDPSSDASNLALEAAKPALTVSATTTKVVQNLEKQLQEQAKQISNVKETDTENVIKKAENNQINIFSKEYWTVKNKKQGLAGNIQATFDIVTKIAKLPYLLSSKLFTGLASTAQTIYQQASTTIQNNPVLSTVANAVTSSPVTYVVKNSWNTIKSGVNAVGKFISNGWNTLFGNGTKYGEGYSKQNDPSIANIKFNSREDTKNQTIGTSGCGPAAAVNAIEALNHPVYGMGPGSILNAAKFALRRGYKETNGGTTPGFFRDYFASKGYNSQTTANQATLRRNIQNGIPTVLMGRDASGTSSSTPYGSNPHYVTATGIDKKGHIIIQDPESKYDNQLYSMNDVMSKTSFGVSAYGSGKYGTGTAEDIWNYLRGTLKMTPAGAAGLMGNLEAESGLQPNNLQNTYERKFGLNDAEYTKRVDNGSYSRNRFSHDSGGYGLAQWTYWSRKQNLYDYIKGKGLSIASIPGQLGYLNKELSNGYSGVLSTLKSTNSVRKASDAVMLKFERPKNQSTSNQIARAKRGEKYYKKYSGLPLTEVIDDTTTTQNSNITATTNLLDNNTNNELINYDYTTSAVQQSQEPLTITSILTSLGTTLGNFFSKIFDGGDNNTSTTYNTNNYSLITNTQDTETDTTNSSEYVNSNNTQEYTEPDKASGSNITDINVAFARAKANIPPGTPMAHALVKAAESQLGVHEVPYRLGLGSKGSNKVVYNDWYFNKKGFVCAWCCIFVSWCARAAGIPKSIIPQESFCKNMYNNVLKLGGKKVDPKNITAGDLVLYKNGNTYVHVGIVVKRINDKKFKTIEGNTYVNKVDYHENNFTKSTIFVRPNYTKSGTGTFKFGTGKIPYFTGQDLADIYYDSGSNNEYYDYSDINKPSNDLLYGLGTGDKPLSKYGQLDEINNIINKASTINTNNSIKKSYSKYGKGPDDTTALINNLTNSAPTTTTATTKDTTILSSSDINNTEEDLTGPTVDTSLEVSTSESTNNQNIIAMFSKLGTVLTKFFNKAFGLNDDTAITTSSYLPTTTDTNLTTDNTSITTDDSSSIISTTPSGTSQAKKLVEVAQKEVGVKEYGNNKVKYVDWYSGKGKSVAWCCIFVSWCANKAGIPTNIIPKQAGCTNMAAKLLKCGAIIVPFKNAAPGDIVLFGKPGSYEHIGIVESNSGGFVHTIEGNYSNKVSKVKYDKPIDKYAHNRPLVIFRPKYATVSSSSTNIGTKALNGKKGIFPTYNLNDKQIRGVATILRHEQPGATGHLAEASLFANIVDKYGNDKATVNNLINKLPWFSHGKERFNNPEKNLPASAIAAAKTVMLQGIRTLPRYVDSHDCWSDIVSVTNNGKALSNKTDRSQYIPHVTKIRNKYMGKNESPHTFYTFPNSRADEFSYSSQKLREKWGEAHYDGNEIAKTMMSGSGTGNNKPLAKYGQFKESLYGTGNYNFDYIDESKLNNKEIAEIAMLEQEPSAYKPNMAILRRIKSKFGTGTTENINNVSYNAQFSNNDTIIKLINTVINVLYTIADNTDKLNIIINILNEKLNLDITPEDISNQNGKTQTLKSKLQRSINGGNSYNGYADTINSTSMNTLINIMNSIASE